MVIKMAMTSGNAEWVRAARAAGAGGGGEGRARRGEGLSGKFLGGQVIFFCGQDFVSA